MTRWLKRGRGTLLLLLPGLALLLAQLTGCSARQDFYLGELEKTEPGAAQGGTADQRRIEELEEGIRKYRREVERKVQASDQLGVYYRMLAVRYMQQGMFGQAYGALEEARKIYPENPVLFYYAGVCAARLGQAEAGQAERRRWLELAEAHYRRALALEPLHSDSLYALAVLYVYELDRPQEAVALLERLLEREKRNADALFLLGAANYRLGRLEDALQAYRRLSGLGLPEERRRQAEQNIRTIEEELRGSQ